MKKKAGVKGWIWFFVILTLILVGLYFLLRSKLSMGNITGLP